MQLLLRGPDGQVELSLDLVPGAAAPGVETLAAAARAGRRTYAMTGSRLLFLGEEIVLAGLACPAPVTPRGRDAKALLNTFLRRAGYFRCDLTEDMDGWRGDCFVSDRRGMAERSIAGGMIDSGLCDVRAAGWTDPRPTGL